MFRRSKLLSLLAVLSLSLVLIFAGCGDEEAEAPDGEEEETQEEEVQEVEEDRLIVAQGADPVSLDPHADNDQPSSRVMQQIYDTLIDQDEDMEIQEGLAEDWEQISENEFRFHLREGVEFHNGEELTAEDVKFSYERLLDPEIAAPGAFILEVLKTEEDGSMAEDAIEIEDDYTFILRTEQPHAPILSHLAHTVTSILNEEAVEEYGDDYGQNPVGSGPFEFVEWQSGDYVDLERFEDYWAGPAGTEEVRFRVVPEDTNRTIELETRGADVIYDVSPIDMDRIDEEEDIELIRADNLSTTYIGFNMDKEPFDDKRVRQAINYALDMEPIVENVYSGLGQPAQGPLGPSVWASNQDVKSYDEDLEKARELLAEAGHEDGFEVELWTNENQQRIEVAEIAQAQLGAIGIDVDVEIMEWGAYLEQTAQGQHDMFTLGWVTVTGDPDYGLYSLFHSDEHGAAGNRTFFDDEEVDELLDRARQEMDEDVRYDAYQEIQEVIAEEAPWIFTWVGEEAVGVGDYVEGMTIHPAGHHSLYDVEIVD